MILKHFHHNAEKRRHRRSHNNESSGDTFRQENAQGGRFAALALTIMWCFSVGVDRIWLTLDQSVPSWDPADHLIGALNYSWMVQNAGWLSADWWHGIWTLSSKYPPLLYLSTTPFIQWLGSSADVATIVNSLYTAILLVSAYGLGRLLFRSSVGLWAAGLCVLFPQFYVLRSQYFMDYPLTAWVTAAFCVLTYWHTRPLTHPLSVQRWLSAIAFGIIFGLASLTKQTAVLFLGLPLLWLGGQSLWYRRWILLIQLIIGSAIAGLMLLPWSRTNWLFQISAAFSANTRSAEIEGDPSVLSVEGWVYYLAHLPRAMSYPLLTTASLGLLIFLIQTIRSSSNADDTAPPYRSTPSLNSSFRWLFIFIGGTYLIWSAIANKDVRYIMPYLPAIAVILGVGMASWRRWWQIVPWATVGLSIALMITNLFTPLDHQIPAFAKRMTPGGQHPIYIGSPWPHAEIIDELIATQPYQLINLGVLPSTPDINQHNLNYFGTRSDFQVYARRMGKSQEHIEQDLRSLSWFVSVTRPQLNHHDSKSRRRQLGIANDLRRSRSFRRQRRWDLPDGSRLDLFRRRKLPVQVTPLENSGDTASDDAVDIKLTHINVPDQSLAGRTIPVDYTWRGSWDALSHGAVILTWQRDSPFSSPRIESPGGAIQWVHDHSIGFGTLRPHPIQANQSMLAPRPELPDSRFKIVERAAMQVPDDANPGIYRLAASYFDTRSGETLSLSVPGVAVRILSSESTGNEILTVVDGGALDQSLVGQASEQNDATIEQLSDRSRSAIREVDWVSQLRHLSTALPQGIDALDPVFDQIGRFSLYDPIQSYAKQAELTLAHRLQLNPNNLDYAYGLALANVLQRDAEGAIATLRLITALDASNPFAYAYLAFVNLYAFHPHAAHDAASRAIALDPNVAEFKLLRVAASVMGGDLWHAWKEGWSAFAA
ncbi:MAG: phospholipid carrier-dependent glycosyltransferase [Cyanobacteria bacterium J06633_2]